MQKMVENRLGQFLKDRRCQLDPEMFGIARADRHDMGLQCEDVAERAGVSVAWYQWLEEGWEDAPSADVLDRVSSALMLSEPDREHLHYIAATMSGPHGASRTYMVPPKLQRTLDALSVCPAYIKSPCWDVVAWNGAARAVLEDYAAVPPDRRNVLRIIFGDTALRRKLQNWETVARHAVEDFRQQGIQMGMSDRAKALVDDLCHESEDFARLWRDAPPNEAGERTKIVEVPEFGAILLDYSPHHLNGHPGFLMVVYTPATVCDSERLIGFLSSRTGRVARSIGIGRL
ncbi:helix-turn-helix transcriptional regulator [Acuticoccus sp. I52.16.1]|uniref:helix-turn-helix transcriptional regulator n=1 Tax=Acuticoccus sp. I52.16.1 TaxID=2928472 RepID=UPI001FD2400F|nr:helix-turn-helix transcriptional regulator [Acuticoccus sp. I52.16.1]UOM35783.1 helix-turn-helix transcriptional regulator [Acuticoccus sp. I52.16.1]